MIHAELLTSFESITLFCIYLCWAISILDLYAVLLHSIIHIFFGAWNWYWTDVQSKNDSAKVVSAPEPCCTDEDVDHEKLYEAEVKMVMERLGVFCHADGGKIQEQLGSNEIATLFDENEPSLEEVREAFDVFDANNDGYIDAKELRKVLCALGFVHVPERVCQSMISSYDDDGDGRINFNEFVKLFEKSFY